MRREMAILDEKEVYRDKWLTVNQLETTVDGVLGSYTTVNKNDCVAVILQCEDQYLLIASYRFPIRSTEWEVLAGQIEPEESAEHAAHRELLEETGVDTCLQAYGSFYIIPGLSDQKVHIFAGEISLEKKRRIVNYTDDVDEILDREFYSMQEICEMIQNGQVRDTITMACFFVAQNFIRG